MAKFSKEAPQNAYKAARLEAASSNDQFGSQDRASEVVLIDRNRLAKIEAGALVPHPEEVLMMADQYGAPELKNHFCRCSCPLGKNLPAVDASDLDRISVRAISTLRKAKEVKSTLLDIVDDGIVSDEERPQFMEIVKTLDELSEINQNLKVWAEKNLR